MCEKLLWCKYCTAKEAWAAKGRPDMQERPGTVLGDDTVHPQVWGWLHCTSIQSLHYGPSQLWGLRMTHAV